MTTYIIDYTRPDGRSNFKTVLAETAEQAVDIFLNAGIDGWSGYNFKDYTITKVSER